MRRSARNISVLTTVGRIDVSYSKRGCVVRFYERAKGMALVDVQVKEFEFYPQWRGVFDAKRDGWNLYHLCRLLDGLEYTSDNRI